MITAVKNVFKSLLNKKGGSDEISITWVKRDPRSWLSQVFSDYVIEPRVSSYSHRIEAIAAHTNELGAQPLWEGYEGNNRGGQTRMPSHVRTSAGVGNLYTFLIQERKPQIIVEFGTAFGVSGMFFLAGINENRKGKLLTFEPNRVWAKIARENLSQICDRFELIEGTFEENIDKVLQRDQLIDFAFIDAIHTKEFVIPQLDMVVARSSDGAIIILDDINFSESMRECWSIVSNDDRFTSSAALGDRVGILELKQTL